MRFIVLLLLLTFVQGQDFTGVGNNYGGGFTPDGKGGWIGWGNRYGQDWRSDGQGGLDGAGKNYGHPIARMARAASKVAVMPGARIGGTIRVG